MTPAAESSMRCQGPTSHIRLGYVSVVCQCCGSWYVQICPAQGAFLLRMSLVPPPPAVPGKFPLAVWTGRALEG